MNRKISVSFEEIFDDNQGVICDFNEAGVSQQTLVKELILMANEIINLDSIDKSKYYFNRPFINSFLDRQFDGRLLPKKVYNRLYNQGTNTLVNRILHFLLSTLTSIKHESGFRYSVIIKVTKLRTKDTYLIDVDLTDVIKIQ